MQTRTLLIIASISVSIFYSQQLLAQSTIRAKSLENLLSNPRVEANQQNTSLIRLRNKLTGNTTLKNIGDYTVGFRKTKGADLVIDMSTIDTSKYSSRYRFWREVPVCNVYHGVTVADINRNGRKEIYGAYQNFTNDVHCSAYEYGLDSAFSLIHQYPDSILRAWSYADVDGDKKTDMAYDLTGSALLLMTQTDTSQLALSYKSYFDTISSSGQPVRASFYDIDSDGKPEMIYYLDGGGDIFPPSNQIAKYNSITNNFDIIYYNRPNFHSEGFAFGDFDMDGKQNIANGGINGEFFMYEHQEGNNYSLKLIDTLPTFNAYLSATTNDVDGDGKPELWMGGDFYYVGEGITRLLMYETNGDDSYEQKYQIDILGVFSFYAGNMVAADLDGDGKEELVVCIDQNVLVFKNTGGNNYALWYIKQNDFALSGANSVYYEVTVADFDGDGRPEVIIGMDEVKENVIGSRLFSRIYKLNTTTAVRQELPVLPLGFSVSQNYPNPFNPSTRISYSVAQPSFVNLVIYDQIGRKVRTLVSEMKAPGYYEVQFDPEGLSAGLYFYRIQMGNFSDVKKMSLLK